MNWQGWQGHPPAPVRMTFTAGMFAYGLMLAVIPERFEAAVYDPARNVMPLAVWGGFIMAAALTNVFGIIKRSLTWRLTFGLPLAVVMITWGILQYVSITVDGFHGDATPGAIPLWATINAMYLMSFLHDKQYPGGDDSGGS